ncbi:MAG: helix-turn-helix transcriptional regulator [bacterium]|nr:helix-turn-helix transcriptional regulator [bacterium]
MEFSERFKKLRTDNKLSQTRLAELTGLHYTQIGRYEKGKALPSADILKKLADIFSVSIDYLVEGTTGDSAKSFLHDKELLRLFREVETLDAKDLETIKIFLDAFIAKRKIQEVLEGRK